MKLKILPLETRLHNIRTGYAAHPEFVTCAIRNMADAPISSYLHQFEPEKKKLAQLLKLDMDELDGMSYKDIAVLIYNLRLKPCNVKLMNEAAELLAAPIFFCFMERKHLYANCKKEDSVG